MFLWLWRRGSGRSHQVGQALCVDSLPTEQRRVSSSSSCLSLSASLQRLGAVCSPPTTTPFLPSPSLPLAYSSHQLLSAPPPPSPFSSSSFLSSTSSSSSSCSSSSSSSSSSSASSSSSSSFSSSLSSSHLFISPPPLPPSSSSSPIFQSGVS